MWEIVSGEREENSPTVKKKREGKKKRGRFCINTILQRALSYFFFSPRDNVYRVFFLNIRRRFSQIGEVEREKKEETLFDFKFEMSELAISHSLHDFYYRERESFIVIPTRWRDGETRTHMQQSASFSHKIYEFPNSSKFFFSPFLSVQIVLSRPELDLDLLLRSIPSFDPPGAISARSDDTNDIAVQDSTSLF